MTIPTPGSTPFHYFKVDRNSISIRQDRSRFIIMMFERIFENEFRILIIRIYATADSFIGVCYRRIRRQRAKWCWPTSRLSRRRPIYLSRRCLMNLSVTSRHWLPSITSLHPLSSKDGDWDPLVELCPLGNNDLKS